MKTAIVHEWFVNYAGSERVVESLTNLFPHADVFALVDFLNDKQREIILKGAKANTSFIQKLPFAKKKHRNYLPLFPMAIEKFNLSDYELIVSSSHAVAKGVKTNKDQLHICYCHSPMRYAWDSADEYLKGFKGSVAKLFVNNLKKWDLKSAENVTHFIANSKYIADKIRRIYNREADVIYPPVDVGNFNLSSNKKDYYLTASRLVPYKKIDLVIKAFNKTPNKRLIVIGSGPEKVKLKKIAGTNIEFIGHQSAKSLGEYMQSAKAFVFAAEEDFGIIVVESMACGTPVIALSKGGTAESVLDGKTGILFNGQKPDLILNAILEFEKVENGFNQQKIREHSLKFSRKHFEEKTQTFINEKAEKFLNN
ncbi:MAG: glycosyltransferase [Ignavibacteriaceae bacterium]|nr:glycosyltransferase [Ignavibacteria bacterium]NNJ52863.1 glycosyltransferase [Ignavibacteriaceae bacterium]NNL20901.1 glycosyltransferase [Ignavibacteriaceae bacterium]